MYRCHHAAASDTAFIAAFSKLRVLCLVANIWEMCPSAQMLMRHFISSLHYVNSQLVWPAFQQCFMSTKRPKGNVQNDLEQMIHLEQSKTFQVQKYPQSNPSKS